MPNAPRPPEVHPDWLRVPLGQGEHADFHHRWLRHHCDAERHPRTGERTRCSSELPDDIHPRHAAIVDEILEVTWSDAHASRYPLAWLRQHAYALGRLDLPPPTAGRPRRRCQRSTSRLCSARVLVKTWLPSLRATK